MTKLAPLFAALVGLSACATDDAIDDTSTEEAGTDDAAATSFFKTIVPTFLAGSPGTPPTGAFDFEVTDDDGTRVAISSPTPSFKISRDPFTLEPLNVSRYVHMQSLDLSPFTVLGFQLYWIDVRRGFTPTVVKCGSETVFSSVVINPRQSSQIAAVMPRADGIGQTLLFTFEYCGVPASVTDMLVFPVPVSTFFTLEGGYRAAMQMVCNTTDLNCAATDF